MKALKRINELKKLFDFKLIEQTQIKKENLNGYMSFDNVLMFIPKILEIENVFKETFEYQKSKIPKLFYKAQQQTGGIYSTDFIKEIFSIIQLFDDEAVLIKSCKDYPLWIETDSYIFILAPKITEIKNKFDEA